MTPGTLHITFADHVEMRDVRETVALARLAAEALHGVDRLALESAAEVDLPARRVALDVSSPCGRDLATLLVGFARREYGAAALRFEPAGREGDL